MRTAVTSSPPGGRPLDGAAVARLAWCRRRRVWFPLLIFVYALAARVFVGLVLPPWQGPDEPRHFEYVRVLVDRRAELWQERRLVRLDDRSPALERDVIASMARHHFWEYANRRAPATMPTDFYELWQGASSQLKQTISPYHWLLAVALLPAQTAPIEVQLAVVRVVSALLSASTVFVTYWLGRLLTSDEFVPMVAATFTATLPMHVFVGGVVNTDNLVTVFGGLTMCLLIRGVRRGFALHRWVGLGACLVFAIFAKRAAVALMPAWALGSVVWPAWRSGRRGRMALGAVSVMAVTVLAATAWRVAPFDRLADWIVGYFFNEPDQLARLFDGRLTDRRALELLGVYVVEMHRSFWGVFGWYSVQLAPTLYELLGACLELCLLGLAARAVVRVMRRGLSALWPGVLVVLGVATIVGLSIAERLTYFEPNGVPSGRYLFVAIAPIAVLLAMGARAYLPGRLLGVRWPTLAMVSALVLLDVAVLLGTFVPAYVGRAFP